MMDLDLDDTLREEKVQGAPIFFVENVGQFDDAARFQVRGPDDAVIWLAEDALWMTILESRGMEPGVPRPAGPGEMDEQAQPRQGAQPRLRFAGANPDPQLVPFRRLDTRISYFRGNDPAQWHADVPVWGGVRYIDLYPGIDLELSGMNGEYTQRLVIDEGADLDAVRIQVDGAEALALDGNDLRLATSAGQLALPLLEVVTSDGRPVHLASRQPTLSGVEVRAPFAIDGAGSPPVSSPSATDDNPLDLLYATFLGGMADDESYSPVADQAGSIYVTGFTLSFDFPTTPGSFDPGYNGGDTDLYVACLSPDGSTLLFVTFLGGSRAESGDALLLDPADGTILIAGRTKSADFPTTSDAFDRSCGTDGDCNFDGEYYLDDAVVARLSSDGSTLLDSTYLGGSERDSAADLTIDAQDGIIFITGSTQSADLPTTPGAVEGDFVGYQDAFVAGLAPNLGTLSYGTYLGGSDFEAGTSLVFRPVDQSIIAVGRTDSPDFPTTAGAFDTTLNGVNDIFVTCFSPDEGRLIFSTYLGGNFYQYAFGQKAVALDPRDGSVIVGGLTWSTDFPTTDGAWDQTCGTDGLCNYDGEWPKNDAFVTHFSADGSTLIYSTFLGGSDGEWAEPIAVDAEGSAYIGGIVWSSDFPTTPDAFDRTHNGGTPDEGRDGFVTRLAPDGSDLLYSTFLGGSGEDRIWGLALDPSDGTVLVAGSTDSSDFPTTAGAYGTTLQGDSDGFVARLAAGRYSISGRVGDINNNPVSGVTISNGAGAVATTDGWGRFVLTDVGMSGHTIVPAKGSYSFVPASRYIAVPPSATDQNFVMLPAPVSVPLTPGAAATLSYQDTQGLVTQLDFSAQAVDQPTEVRLTPTLAAGAVGYTFAGHAFQLEAYLGGVLQPGFAFGAPVTVTIHYSDQDIRVVRDEGQLALWWMGTAWQDAAGTCDPASTYDRNAAGNVLSVPICHLSLFGLFGPTNQVYLPLVLRGGP
ncbi:MAG: hypothetical protein JXA93_01120 [Anaerolineae bacterium]|nr:hypothetical protein [Anaerolineae bacterium]